MHDRPVVQLGCDTGEAIAGADRIREQLLLLHVTAVSIACGGHAGDYESIREAITAAQDHDCLIGAHPSFPDRAGFGRRAMKITRVVLEASIREQLNVFSEIAIERGASVHFVKAHGALYHVISKDIELAHWYWSCCKSVFPGARFVGPLGSKVLDEFKSAGIPVFTEGFCDRVYEPSGGLRPRSAEGACITNPEFAVAQAERIIGETECDLLCVHSDTQNAAAIAEAVSGCLHELRVHPDQRS